MDYKPGDIVEFNFNSCLLLSLPSVECEVLRMEPKFPGVYRLKLPDGFDPVWARFLSVDAENTFTFRSDWFRLVSGKPIPVDVSNLL